MWIEPQEYIDAGDRLVVPVRFGGQARQPGIEIEFSVAHVFTMRDGKATPATVGSFRDARLAARGHVPRGL